MRFLLFKSRLNQILVLFLVSSLPFSPLAGAGPNAAPNASEDMTHPDANALPQIEGIEGSKSLILVKEGNQREGTVGTSIEYGEKVITDEKSSAVILYPEGSKIRIAANSEFTIEEITEGTHWNRLKSGSVRGIITKTVLPASTKPKFIIRNKAAVLGVRGTDFVMAVAAGNSATAGTTTIHTLEGSVEVAKNELQLFSSKGTLVNEGQYIEATPQGLSPVQSYDKAEFIKNLDPGLTPLKKTNPSEPVGDATGNLAPSHSQIPPSSPAPTKFRQPPASAESEALQQQMPQNNKNDSSRAQYPENYKDRPAESKSGLNLLEFQTALFYAILPDTSQVRALNVVWTPRFTLPYLTFLSIHPSVGGNVGANGSLNNNFLVMEYEMFLTLSLFETFYGEVGMGEQIWRGAHKFDAGLATVNLGILVKLGIIDRIFVGYQVINYLPVFNEYKAGIGIKF